MGEVYRARDTALGRDVALKILPELFAADADRLARFEREAQALASLNHPNIAQVYAIAAIPPGPGATSGGRAIVMELVEGEDLSQIIARHGHSAPAAAEPSESASRGAAARGVGPTRNEY